MTQDNQDGAMNYDEERYKLQLHSESLAELWETVEKINKLLKGNGDLGFLSRVINIEKYIVEQAEQQKSFRNTLRSQSIIVMGSLVVAVVKWFIIPAIK